MGQFRDNFVEIPDFVFFFGKIEILFSRIDTNAISQFKHFQSQHFLENFGHFSYNGLAERRAGTEFVLKIPEFLSQNSFSVVYKSGGALVVEVRLDFGSNPKGLRWNRRRGRQLGTTIRAEALTKAS